MPVDPNRWTQKTTEAVSNAATLAHDPEGFIALSRNTVNLRLSCAASADRSPSPPTTSYQFWCHISDKPVTEMTGTDRKSKTVAETDRKSAVAPQAGPRLPRQRTQVAA